MRNLTPLVLVELGQRVSVQSSDREAYPDVVGTVLRILADGSIQVRPCG